MLVCVARREPFDGQVHVAPEFESTNGPSREVTLFDQTSGKAQEDVGSVSGGAPGLAVDVYVFPSPLFLAVQVS